MSESRQPPLLFLNPADDEAFRQRVDELMANGPPGSSELEKRLRADFPRAIVRPRDLASEQLRVWYIYRDGHWVGSRGGRAPV